jgi:hypothetical protein
MIVLAEQHHQEGLDEMVAPNIQSTEDYLTKLGTGDINSTAKGSGARFNAGKSPMELVPLRLLAENLKPALGAESENAAAALLNIGFWQERRSVRALESAVRLLGSNVWHDCANVFDYGQRKYKAWNWAKGMPWSVPMACAARHLVAMIQGEINDPESGLPHSGHVACNIVMLLTYADTYPEGDDRPPAGALGKIRE